MVFDSEQLDREQKKVDVEFTRYLVSLCDREFKRPNYMETFRQFFTDGPDSGEKELSRRLNLIKTLIKDMEGTVQDFDKRGKYVNEFYIDEQYDIKNYPWVFIIFLKYCSRLYELYGTDEFLKRRQEEGLEEYYTEIVRDNIKTNFIKIGELCRNYIENGCRYSSDDKLKELLLLQNRHGAVESFFQNDFREYVVESARKYRSFHDVLSELAEKKGYKGSDGLIRLYREAGLAPAVHTSHRNIRNKPKREHVFDFILILKLGLQDAEELLKAAGFQFNDSIGELFIRSMIITKQWNLSLYRQFNEQYFECFCKAHDVARAQVENERTPEGFLNYLYSVIRDDDFELPADLEKRMSKEKGCLKLKRLYYWVFGADGLEVFKRHKGLEPDKDAETKKHEIEEIADALEMKPGQRERLLLRCPGIEHLL